jgi:hypothetical protein
MKYIVQNLNGDLLIVESNDKPSNYIAEYSGQVSEYDLKFTSFINNGFVVDTTARDAADAQKVSEQDAIDTKKLERENNRADLALSLKNIDSINNINDLKAVVKLLVEGYLG